MKKRELNTIQRKEKLNRVYAICFDGESDEKEQPGGACHDYEIDCLLEDGKIFKNFIFFQNGPRKSSKSVQGVLDCDLLEIVRDRLLAFQAGAFANDYTGRALYHVEEALYQMNLRVEDRISRNVLGTMEK